MSVESELSLPSPDLAEYNVVDHDRSQDLGGLTLQRADVSIHFTSEGVEQLERNTAFVDLASRIGHYIGEHGSFNPHHIRGHLESQSLELLKAATPDDRRAPSFSSVYGTTDGQVPFVVKSFVDKGDAAADLQLNTMAWLSRELAAKPNPDVDLSAPKQFAMVESARTGRKTVIMEQSPGESLRVAAYRMAGIEARAKIDNGLYPRVNAALATTLGSGVKRLTDLSTANLLVDGPIDTERPKISVIDQPSADTRKARLQARAAHALSRVRR